jgi:hypothetical protein
MNLSMNLILLEEIGILGLAEVFLHVLVSFMEGVRRLKACALLRGLKHLL